MTIYVQYPTKCDGESYMQFANVMSLTHRHVGAHNTFSIVYYDEKELYLPDNTRILYIDEEQL